MPLFPDMITRWLILFVVVAAALGLTAWYWPAPLESPADPTDSSYVPKPEWWVLFLNQLVSVFRGPLMIIGTVVVPGGLALLLLALPFIDRSPERHPLHRKKSMAVAIAIVFLLTVLSIMAYVQHFVKPHP